MSAYVSGNLAYQYPNETQDVKKVYNKRRQLKATMPRAEKLFYLFAVIFIVFLSSVVISGYAEIAEMNYEIQKTEKSIVTVNEGNENLERRIAELNSPEKILEIAQNELGMSLNEEQIIVLSNR